MGYPDLAGSDNGMASQILIKLGEMSTQLGIITEQLKAIPDHENRIRTVETLAERLGSIPDHEIRIRSLERFRYGLPAAGLTAAVSTFLTIWNALKH